MEYKVGSLADMISRSTTSRETKDVKIKFETLQFSHIIPSKKRKSEVMHGSTHSKVKKLNNGSPAAVTRVKVKREEPYPVVPEEKKPVFELDPEQEARTIFVGNLIKSTTKYQLKTLFGKYGKVETVRLRSAPVADPRTPKKVAVIKGEFHEKRTNINAYIRYTTTESARNALAANGTVINDHTIRVDMAAGGGGNMKKAVFVGNIKFTVTEEDLRNLFGDCGDIHSIRLVRDRKTGMGKGFAFINFEESAAVELALQLDGEDMEKRPIRVSRCTVPSKSGSQKKKKKLKGALKTVQTNEKTGKKKKGGSLTPEKKSVTFAADFQGQETVDKKNKKLKKQKLKKNKSEKKRKMMLHKLEIVPKSKVKKIKKKNKVSA